FLMTNKKKLAIIGLYQAALNQYTYRKAISMNPTS
ncbi:hypothetical protein AVEN_86774-1, partial [Araneus ventricosus]